MNNLCPTCGSGYNLTPAHVGRQFACKKCGDTLLVTAAGLRSSRAPAAEPAGFGDLPATFQPAGPYAAAGGSSLVEYLTFRKMIVPTVIQVLFWVGVVACILGGVFLIVAGAMNKGDGSVIAIATGFGYMLLGPLAWRIYCELIIIFFRIHDTLGEIRDHLQRHPR